MLQVENGQCGLCAHFGETAQGDEPQLIQIRTSHEAQESLVEPCGLPQHAKFGLMVTAVSACNGFTPAEMANA